MSTDLIVLVIIVIVGGGMLGTWWYSVAILQPRIRRDRTNIFRTYIQARGGTIIPLPNMDSLTIFDIGSEKMRRMNREAEIANPQIGNQQLYCTLQGDIQLSDRQVRVAYGAVGENEETTVPIIFWRVPLQGSVDGWARLRDAYSRFKGTIKTVEVESIDVNRAVRLHAHPKKLGFQLFPPDMLDWYLHLPQKPWIYVEGSMVTVVVEGVPKLGVCEASEQLVIQILNHIERSGALDKTTSSA